MVSVLQLLHVIRGLKNCSIHVKKKSLKIAPKPFFRRQKLGVAGKSSDAAPE